LSARGDGLSYACHLGRCKCKVVCTIFAS
jgi:hypothetical protein